MVVDDVIDVLNLYSKRSLRLVSRMVDMHLEIAQQEAIQEQRRLMGAMVALAIGATLLTTGFILSQAFLMLWLYDTQQDHWLVASAGLVAFDLLFGGLLIFFGVTKLRQPIMPNTVSQLTRTTSMLLSDDLDSIVD